jgi:hypothetical protein
VKLLRPLRKRAPSPPRSVPMVATAALFFVARLRADEERHPLVSEAPGSMPIRSAIGRSRAIRPFELSAGARRSARPGR